MTWLPSNPFDIVVQIVIWGRCISVRVEHRVIKPDGETFAVLAFCDCKHVVVVQVERDLSLFLLVYFRKISRPPYEEGFV